MVPAEVRAAIDRAERTTRHHSVMTVFIRVAHAAYRMRELHDLLNIKGLACKEEWPYMPHLTIVKMGTENEAQHAYRMARTRWAEFEGKRCVAARDLNASIHWFLAIEYSQVVNLDCPRYDSRLWKAFRNTSCATSVAASTSPVMR